MKSILMNYKYKFSVVMAIYNTEEYVSDAIESVINQEICFEDNIQLILIDDGSTYNTPNILNKYQKIYPNNILVLTQENNGQASARNSGLNYVKGKYVNFLDSDDYLSLDAMESVYNFFEEHYEEIDFVSIRQNHFGRKETEHMLNYRFDNGDTIIDLTKDPNNPQLACNSAFFKKELFDTYKFPTNVIFSEDAILVNKILMEKKKYGVLLKPIYYYRKREDLTSTIDIVASKKEYFTDKLKYYYLELINYSLKKEEEVVKFIQYLCAYDLQWMISQPSIEILETKEKKEEFWDYLDKVISYLDYEVIADNRTIKNKLIKSFFIYLKNKELHYKIENNTSLLKSLEYTIDDLSKHRFWIDIVEIKDETLTISGFFNSNFDMEFITIDAVKTNENKTIEYFVGKSVKYTSRENIKYLDQNWEKKYNFDINIKLKKNEDSIIQLKVNFHKDGNLKNFNEDNLISKNLTISFTKTANLNEKSNFSIQESRIILFEANLFYLHNYKYKSMIKYERNVIKKIKRYEKNKESPNLREFMILRLLHLILFPFFKNKQIYLFMDRGTESGDNALYLFKYANSLSDGAKKYYVLSKENKDFNKISKFGNVVNYKSFKHKFLYLFAKKIICTHPYETIVNPFFSFKNEYKKNFSGLNNPKLYFLQHGVTKDNISSWFSRYDKNVSLIVTVSDKEKESFYEEGYGYDKNIIQTLGFPRFDALKDCETKKQILIIPTWRKNIRGSKSKFMNSDYFKSISKLLNNKKLIEISHKNGYKIIFKPHPELNKTITEETDEKYIDLFKINEKVIISNEKSYSELFEESDLMITDYSSVFFDFAYLEKPIIYYHPVEDYHYENSYFDYETMGFGEITQNENELLNLIEEYLSTGCKMKNIYKENVTKFFKYHDHNNCKRVYGWIKQH